MIAAGLLARNALSSAGSTSPRTSKTSLAPGSRVVTEYLEASGFSRTSKTSATTSSATAVRPVSGTPARFPSRSNVRSTPRISGPRASFRGTATSRLASTRRFVRTNYLASPPLVVAYGLAGRMDIDLEHDPLGTDADGDPVYLADIWPDADEIHAAVHDSVDSSMFEEKYASVFEGDERAGRHSMRRPVRSTSGTTLRRTSASRPSSRTSRWKSPVSQISTTPAR